MQVTHEQSTQKWEGFQRFASLTWYDAFIEFIFRFAAKTSEPLLALGIVYSAADVLSHGHLSGNNQTSGNLWALTQALAIESSGGVVLVYGLTSLKEQDQVKAILYLTLSTLLAVAGGIMLFMQLAGWEQQQNDSTFMLVLFGLRCVVSVGYIYLCRTKHIRFTKQVERTEPNPREANGANGANEQTMRELSEQVANLTASIRQITMTMTEVKTTVTEITAANGSLPVLSERTHRTHRTHRTEPTEPTEPIIESELNSVNKKELIRQFLQANPHATLPDIMDYAKVGKSYASTTRSQIQKGE